MAGEQGDSPAPMEGGGSYNRASAVQAAGAGPAVPLLEAAATVVPVTAAGPLAIVDYGVSEGRNSMAPIGAAIAVLRGRVGAERAITVFHTDLPDNDFAALFETLARDPASYMAGDAAVFPAAVGRSFYGQILPAGSVTLGWSSWAVQWLSRVPGPIPDQVQVAYSRDDGARARYDAQAAEDWAAFLTHRAVELVPGGRLVVATMATDDDGAFGYRPLVESLYDALGEMVDAGLASPAEKAAMAIPTVGRSRAELLAPFAGGRFHGLAMERLEIFHGEDPIGADYAATGDAQAWAERWTAFNRASVFPTLATRIEGPDAPARRAAFIAALDRAVARRLAGMPQRMIIPLARMVIVREA